MKPVMNLDEVRFDDVEENGRWFPRESLREVDLRPSFLCESLAQTPLGFQSSSEGKSAL